MDGSLLGQDFTTYITAAWGLSALMLGGVTGWAVWRYRRAGRSS